MNHAEAVSMVRGKRNKDSRKIGNNTYAEILHDDTVAIKLHNTYVVKINSNGTYTLNSGGWQTVTTKDRINQYSPVRVYQRDFTWYVKINSKEYPFIDGMVVGG
jgi:site-specific DNA-adenine methylase